MIFQSSTKLSYLLFFAFHIVTIVFHFYLYFFKCFLLLTFLFLFVSSVMLSTFLEGLLNLYFIYVFFFYNHSCVVVGASPNNVIVTLMLLHWGYLILSFLLFSCHWNFLISISCLLMAYGDEPTLKKHCVDVLKYSIDVFSYSLLTLFCLVITSNQKVNFHFFNFVDFQTFESLDLQYSRSTSIMPFGFNYILHDHGMWAMICGPLLIMLNHVMLLNLLPISISLLNLIPHCSQVSIEDFDSLVHSESFHPKFEIAPL